MRKGSLFAVITAVAAFVMVAQVASAQYPPPKTTLLCAVNQIDVKSDTSTAIAATLRDSGGQALAGHTVHFEVISGSASLSSSTAVTDNSGTAVVTVRFGNSGGTVVIKASSESAECQARTDVTGVVPPSTGDAGLLGSDSGSKTATVAGLGIGVVMMAAGAYALRRSRVA